MSSNPLLRYHFTSVTNIEAYFRQEIIKTKSLLSDAQERLLEVETNPAQNPKVHEIIQKLIQLSILQLKIQIEELAVAAAREINQYVVRIASEALGEIARTHDLYPRVVFEAG